jgi:F-type H+-transporting ATPase subunit alpha
VDVGKSVSRVGGKAQLPAFRAAAGDLRISYSQFEELETFSRFGTRLDEATRCVLERGWRVREILKQPQYRPIPVSEQIAALVAITTGSFDDVPTERIIEAETLLRKSLTSNYGDLCGRIEAGEKLNMADRDTMVHAAAESTRSMRGEKKRADQ